VPYFCGRCGENLVYIIAQNFVPGWVFVNYSKVCDIRQLWGPKGCRIFQFSGYMDAVPEVYVSVPGNLKDRPDH